MVEAVQLELVDDVEHHELECGSSCTGHGHLQLSYRGEWNKRLP